MMLLARKRGSHLQDSNREGLEMKSLLFFVLVVHVLFVAADDVTCKKKGKFSKTITIGSGDSYSFNTQAKKKYGGNVKCSVTYKRGSSCPKIRFSCSKFNIDNKKSKCSGKTGDRMMIQEQGSKKPKSYCKKKSPDVSTTSKFLKVSFISNKKKHSTGAECRIECESDTTTPPSTGGSGIVISGGAYSNQQSQGRYESVFTVEVFNPITGQSCSLPSLPVENEDPAQGRLWWRHTMNGLLICGGSVIDRECITFSSGQWVTSHSLSTRRVGHSSWNTEKQIVLMGGTDYFSTEIVMKGEEEGVEGFRLKYRTDNHCSINDKDTNTVVITGGFTTKETVSRYSAEGTMEYLPSLNEGRYNHGCGSYSRDDGKQVFLVAGGKFGTFVWDVRTSTELLDSTSSAWVLVADALPRKLQNLNGINLGNVLYMTGGMDGDGMQRDEIFKWTGETWEEVAKMKNARWSHAVSTIQLNDPAMDFCS